MSDMQPTEDQQLALDQMVTWINEGYSSNSRRFVHDKPYYVLQGYAGTGKSFAITKLIEALGIRQSEIAFTAPTNKAAKVLRNYLDDSELFDCPTRTIYSLLGLSLQANGEIKELARPEEPVDLSGYRVIIVDEASMVNRFLMEAIADAYSDWGRPFIFMGDPAQLPPVGEIRSPVFEIDHGFTLTKVLRYGNSMLDLATRIRNIVDHPFPSIQISSNPPVYRISKSDWFSRIIADLELLKEGEAKIIAWRNVKVDEYNQMVRKQIFGQEARANFWLPGDEIIAKAPLKDLDDRVFMQNAEEATIEEIAIGTHPIFSEYEIYNLLVAHESGRKFTIRTLTQSGQFQVNNRLNELSMQAKNGQRYKWKEFWELKEAFHEVKHAYAITSHMSQGSSYKKVFVDLEDIMLNRNRQEAFRSLYVAATRQREEIYFA